MKQRDFGDSETPPGAGLVYVDYERDSASLLINHEPDGGCLFEIRSEPSGVPIAHVHIAAKHMPGIIAYLSRGSSSIAR